VNSKKYIKITQIRSVAGRLLIHKKCIKGLGLKRIHQTVQVEDTPAIKGMIDKVAFLLKVEEMGNEIK
jgi:large subunit ribosomal protein L30